MGQLVPARTGAHFSPDNITAAQYVHRCVGQAGGILLLNAVENPQTKVVYFMSIDKAKFRRPVLPGDQLRFELKMLAMRRNTCKMSGEAFIDGELAAEAEFMAMVRER